MRDGKTQKQGEAKRLEEQIQNDEMYARELEQKVSWLTDCFEAERDLGYILFAKQEEKLDSAQIVSCCLEQDDKIETP